MKKSILIYGAGAIGRGFIPWVFCPADYEYYYVETNSGIREKLNRNKKYSTYKTSNGKYESLEVPIKHCFALGEEKQKIPEVDAIVTAVGPRNVLSLRESLMKTAAPVICCENDATLPEILISLTSNPNIVFAIPDVISSNTAPPNLLAYDPLSIVTEEGICFIDEKASRVGGCCTYLSKEKLKVQWLAKLYIHNSPHCIAAYLGSLSGVTYLHESMQNQFVEETVSGAMREMEQMLSVRYRLDETFLEWYRDKELDRFRNSLLYDPINRVAREPFRKLSPNDRLIGAAELCLRCGVIPKNIMLGIMAAFCYENDSDPDFNIKYLMSSLTAYDFLKIIIRLRPGEALFDMLLETWESNLLKLRSLKNE